jgi:capsular polysaccharide export protein
VTPAHRAVLFLEGPLSPLYRLVAGHLRDAGVAVTRINLCPGDRAAWGLARAVDYRGRLAGFAAHVERVIAERRIDAVLMHSEQRPYHREAAAVARRLGVAVYVTELGYLRPDWMTLERNGNSVDSLFPTDPESIRAIAAVSPEVDTAVLYPREPGLETADDLANSIPNVLLWWLYPHYRAHGLYHPFVAYARFLWREAQAGARTRGAQTVRDRLRPPFFLFAMQTDTDFQIRTNSQFADMREALGATMASFAAHAAADARLVVKKHPGDLGPVNWAAEVPRLAAAAGLADRVDFADGLPMSAWVADAAGCVTVNSSAGIDALAAACPTITLSPAIYTVPGLTFEGSLDVFWRAATPPDAALFAAFRKALAASVQVRGTIYSRAGTRAAAAGIADRILAGTVGLPGATEEPPPRHAAARVLGIR